MNGRRCCFLLFFFSLLSLASAQPGTGVWMEPDGMDAPEGVPAGQDTMGMGALTEIRGSLDPGKGDFVDTFCIVIDDPLAFYASTSAHLGGSFLGPQERLANTRIWLWAKTDVTEGTIATIAVANDDDQIGADFGSTVSSPDLFEMLTSGLVDPSADGVILEAGRQYLVSIASSDNDPLDAAGTPLAAIDLMGLTRLYGANTAAGPFTEWANPAAAVDAGAYVIALSGARFCIVPEPAMALFGAWGGLLIAMRARRMIALRGRLCS